MAKKAKKIETSMKPRVPDPMDIQIGARIRMRRIEQRMSQAVLAGKIGVTFQQVQKYEKGTNRIGGSRMMQIAKILDIDVGQLMQSSGANAQESKMITLITDSASQRLLVAFHKIKDQPTRYKVVGLLESITRAAA